MAKRLFLAEQNTKILVACLTFVALYSPRIHAQSPPQAGNQLHRKDTLGSHAIGSSTQFALPSTGEVAVHPLAPAQPDSRDLNVGFTDASTAARPALTDFEDRKQFIQARSKAVVRDNLDLFKDGELREVWGAFPGGPSSHYRISRSGNALVLHLRVLFHSTDKKFFDRARNIIEGCKSQVVDMYKRAGLGLDLALMFKEGNQAPDANVSLWPEVGQTDSSNYYFGSEVMPFDCGTLGHELSHLFGLPDEYHVEVNGRPNYYTDEFSPKPVMKCGTRLEELELYPRNVAQIIRQAFPPKFKVTIDPEKIKALSNFRAYDEKTVGAKFALPEAAGSLSGPTVKIIVPKNTNGFEMQGFSFSDIEPTGPYNIANSGNYALVLSVPSLPHVSIRLNATSFFDLNNSALKSLEKLGLQIKPSPGPMPRLTRDELTLYEQFERWGTRPSD